MMNTIFNNCCIALLCAGFVSLLQADTTIYFKQKGMTDSGSGNVIYIKNGKINFSEADSKNGEYSLFDASKHQLVHISPQHRAYIVMDEKSIDQQMRGIQKQMQTLMDQMKAQMESMPPEQRQMMEKMLGEQGISTDMTAMPKPPVRDIVDTGRTDKISGVPCQVKNVTIQGKLAEEYCIAKESDLNISRSDQNTIREMRAFIKQLSEKANSIMDNAGQDISTRFDGVPIRTRRFNQQGKLVFESILERISSKAIDEKKMQIPEGYQQQQLM